MQWLTGKKVDFNEQLWFQHGGKATVMAYEKITPAEKEAHITFLQSLQNYHLDSQNRLFVHAGFTNVKGVEHEYFKPLFYWDRTLWETALAMDNQLSKDALTYPNRLKIYKEIERIAVAGNYAVVFDRSVNSNVLYANNRYDKTEEVLRKLGIKTEKE